MTLDVEHSIGDDELLGDDLESLREGLRETAARRRALTQRFGFVPLSVLRNIPMIGDFRNLFVYERERLDRQRAGTETVLKKSEKMARLGIKANVSGSKAGRGTPGITSFAPELVSFFARYYSAPGQTYLDPFIGRGMAMQVATRLGMNYRGYDLSREFMAYVDAIARKIDNGKTTIQVVCGDSRHPVEIPDDCGDFGFTSPPYWDIEFYGNEPEQLGTGRTYDDFLNGMEHVARAWLPKFKKGAYYVVNVNDFRKAARFYPYHADTISLHQRAGWQIHDTWIIEGMVGGMSRVFAASFNFKRIAPKVHEFALVFRKP